MREACGYRWLCGGVTVNHHLLSDFRSGEGGWSELLTQIIAPLLAEGLVTMDRVAQDGMRVRAKAGKSSFRHRATWNGAWKRPAAVEILQRLADESPDELTKRQRAARERAANERAERIAEAFATARNCNSNATRQPARAAARPPRRGPRRRSGSTRDAVFGRRIPPGLQLQFSTATDTGIIVGVDVTDAGTDQDQLPPMLEQLKERYSRVPEESLVDGGFASLDD